MIPHSIHELLAQLGAWLTPVYFGNPLKDWLVAALIILFSTTLARAAYWLLLKTFKRLTALTATRIDDVLIEILEKPLIMLLIMCGIWFGLAWLILPPHVDQTLSVIFRFVITLMVAWILVRLIDVLINEYLQPLAAKSANSLDDQILPVLQKGGKLIIWAVALIICINNAGYDVAALLAGLGIGGIALAMAAKDTIANIFGGLTIITDRPFHINDRIKISGYDGTVTDIGVRSTRLQTLEGRTVTIPNLKFAESPVENVSWEPSRKVVMGLNLVYETSPEQMQRATSLLREIATSHPDTESDVTVYFSGFGVSALNIELVYFIRKQANISATQSDVNFSILKKFNEAGLVFAYPTQTVYTATDRK